MPDAIVVIAENPYPASAPADSGADALRPAVVYEDAWLLALDKPAGLLSVPGRGPDKADCLSQRAARHWPGARVVHRLDEATSGLMLMARDAATQRALGAAFEARRIAKRYEAVVHGLVPAADAWANESPLADAADAAGGVDAADTAGAPEAACGWRTIDLPLSADWPRRPRSKVDRGGGKPSLTRWRVLARDAASGTSRLALAPLTGRSHQLRVHLLAVGHPIVGDRLYGPPDGAARLLLHASSLAFTHPATGQTLRLRSPAPF